MLDALLADGYGCLRYDAVCYALQNHAMDSILLEYNDPRDKEDIGWKLEKELIVGGPVTCVSLLSEQHCLIARGPWLILYSSKHPTRRIQAFLQGGSIHGIKSALNGISIVFGGRKLAMVEGCLQADAPLRLIPLRRNKSVDQNSIEDFVVSDWIWDIKIRVINESSDLLLAIGLANNACEIWRLDVNGPTAAHTASVATRLQRVAGKTRCITYAMAFYGWSGSNIDSLIVASGSVFSEILLWTVSDSTNLLLLTETSVAPANSTFRQELHRLKGHKGVIHSLEFDKTGALLASTSDDRSVRLWQQAPSGEWASLWIGWGHTARVWNAAFSPLGLVSTGEDGSVRVWEMKNGYPLSKIQSYSCQCLWRVDVRDNLVVVGGNDGSAKLWDLDTRVAKSVSSTETHNVDGAFTSTLLVPKDRPQLPSLAPPAEAEIDGSPTSKRKKKKTTLKVNSQVLFGMEFFRCNGVWKLLVATRAGSLFSYCLEAAEWTELKPWWVPCVSNEQVACKEGLCLAINSSGEGVAVGTSRGDLVCLRINQKDTLEDSEPILRSARNYRSIQRIHWIDNENLMTMHIKGILVWWRSPLLDSEAAVPVRVFKTTTEAIPTCLSFNRATDLLVVGDSRGNLTTFRAHQPVEDEEIEPLDVGHRYHRKEHVNAVVQLEDGRLLSVGNDGCIQECHITLDGKLCRNLSLPGGSLSGLTDIWTATGTDKETSVIVGGYHGNDFIAMDPSTGYEFFRFDTGGRQRNLACFRTASSHSIAVGASQKDGTNHIILHCYFSEKSSWTLDFPCGMGTTLHSEPVYDATAFMTKPGADYFAVLTGSEDCTARLSLVRESSVVMSTLLPPQESCVRAVSSSRHRESTSTLLTICGGKLTVQFYLLRDEKGHRPCISFQQAGRFPSKPSIDHRINAAVSTPLTSSGEEKWHLVITGDSDGGVYLFHVPEHTHRSSLVGHQLVGDSRPVLALEIVKLSHRIILLIGNTAGEISLWDLAADYESIMRGALPASTLTIKAHQAGTNSISATWSSEAERLRICSGGDDQALTVCDAKLALGENKVESFDIMQMLTTREASESAIKGVKILSKDLLVSVGYCQRLALWRVETDGSLYRVTVNPVDVADVNCLAHCQCGNKEYLIVGGEGVELHSLFQTWLEKNNNN